MGGCKAYLPADLGRMSSSKASFGRIGRMGEWQFLFLSGRDSKDGHMPKIDERHSPGRRMPLNYYRLNQKLSRGYSWWS